MLKDYNNCDDKDCRHLVYDLWKDDYFCNLDCVLVNDKDCIYFEPRQRCDDCDYAKIVTYETGTIDEIDYYCKLQGDALIYKDVSFEPFSRSWPDCPINRFKERSR